MILDLHSEKFGATGGMAGDGARRVLGRPNLNALELVVREALQNSWDAKLPDAREVRFSIDAWRLDARQQSVLAEQVFGKLPRAGLNLKDRLRGEIDVIVVSDRGTVGLAGPTRTDARSESDAPTNFIEFFRNIGRLRTGDIGGGTYGFGKASLYAVSSVSTIVVHTRVRSRGKYQSRFMASALGQQVRSVGRVSTTHFTGRHWWGTSTRGVVEPVTGTAADRLAASLGFRAFGPDETGTSIMIVAPRLPESDPSAALERAAAMMCNAALWYAWPLMLAGNANGHPLLRLSGTFQGSAISVPEIDSDPLLSEYAKAFRHALTAKTSTPADPISGLTMTPLNCLRPVVALGRLALTRVFSNLTAQVTDPEGDDFGEIVSIPKGAPAHVAIMRGPRLVVRYLSFPAPPGIGFVGVFVADEELNAVFAGAEPVTHDDWNSENLEQPRDRTIVRVTHKRIRDRVLEFVQPAGTPEAAAQQYPLGRVARLLGGLIPGAAGPGAEAQSSRTGREGGGSGISTKRSRTRVEMLPEVHLDLFGGVTTATFPFRVTGGHDGTTIRLGARANVLTADGGSEGDPPQGAAAPSIVGWSVSGQMITGGGGVVEIEPDVHAVYAVHVTVPESSAVTASVFLDDGESA